MGIDQFARACTYSMHYALTPRTFLYSHYFSTGLRIATGVLGLTILTLWATRLDIAMVVCIGALCTSLMDLPSPLRHKFNEMLASVLLGSAVTLAISLCAPFHWLLGIMVAVVSFFASMMVAFGRKGMPLQFAALFAMSLAMQTELRPLQAISHAGLFLAGGLAYLCYAIVIAWVLRRRIKEQVLAEALYELALYVSTKAGFYDIHVDLKQQSNALIRRQVVLAERQQAARDLILRGRRGEHDQVLVRVHYAMLDLYELVLATHTDYALLRRQFADADVLTWLRDLVAKAARDIGSLAFAITSHRPSVQRVSYAPELRALAAALDEMEQHHTVGKEGMALLRSSYSRISGMVGMIAQLHRATQPQAGEMQLAAGADMTPFLTQQRYELGVLRDNLRRDSPIFRFSLRVLLAVGAGLLVADHLPYTSHGYWIVLTIAVILKPTYSMTRQRRRDRVIGTLLGCGLTALILQITRAPPVLLAFLFIATAAGPAFVQIKYRYTAIAASMQILLQISLLLPGSTHAISERLLDTLVGAVIATLFSFVFPTWEYRSLPRLLRNVLQAGVGYIGAARDLLQDRVESDFVYRLRRKQFTDHLAALSASLIRMQDEPPGKQRAVEEINQFILQNYLVAAQVAAIRLLLRNHPQSLPRDTVNAWLEKACDQACRSLENARSALDSGILPEPAAEQGADADGPWPGWAPLQRRTGLLLSDARTVALQAAAIGRALRGAA
jgi:uncharacterized membrane protein YccC